MEPSMEPITVRIGKLNNQIVGQTKISNPLLSREGLLDALQVLYDECDSEYLRNLDKNISTFVEQNKKIILEIKHSRVNVLDFELKNVIGRGHFGEVHMVKEKQTGYMYAMKIIKKHQSLQEKNVAFQEERNIMAFTESSWLTRLQYAFQDNSNLYFIMEYHPGGDLLGLLYRQGGTLPESAASFYIAEIIMALNDLHNMGYVHRDIKPDNILLDRCGHLKLADFGSAAKLNTNGLLSNGVPVGTPDYIAPEVLQSMNNKNTKTCGYGISCDYWSLGIIAYELIVGNTPFTGNNTATIYAKIMNHSQHLRFPTDLVLSQAYVSLVKSLITDNQKRLTYPKVIEHPLFQNVDFNSLRQQVPPFVPKITSVDDTSNFSDVQLKKNQPNMENFKKKTQFSGRNLPFVGFTFTQDVNNYKERFSTTHIKDSLVDNMKSEMDQLQKKLMKSKDWINEKENLEKNFEDVKRKLSNIENVRSTLEKDLAKFYAENSALKRTLDIERKDRTELERQALDLIKSAKQKWEASEKVKLDALNCQIEEQNVQFNHLMEENEVLKERLNLAMQLENTHKVSLEKVEKLNRKSVVGLESRLEKITSVSQNQISNLEKELEVEKTEKEELDKKLAKVTNMKLDLQEKLQFEEKKNSKLEIEVAKINKQLLNLKDEKLVINNENIVIHNQNTKLEDKINMLNKEIIELKHDKKNLQVNFDKEQDHCKKLDDKIEKLTVQLSNYKVNFDQAAVSSAKNHLESLTKLQEKIKIINERNNELEIKLQEAKENDEENKKKVKHLEELLNRLESGISKLENSSDREDILQEQVQRLEQQLMAMHETSALEKQEMLKIKSTLWKCEKELSNSNLDKKIVERDLVEVQNENKKLKNEINDLNKQLISNNEQHEKGIMELNDMNENMMNEIFKLKELNDHLKSEVSCRSEKQVQEQNVIIQLKEQLCNKESNINELNFKIQSVIKEKDSLLLLMQKKDLEKQNVLQDLEKINESRKTDFLARENYRIDLQKANENIKSLKEVCTLLENQLIEFEKLKVEHDATEEASTYKIEQLSVELDQIKLKFSDAKKLANEEKSLKFMAESKCKRLLEDNETLQNDIELYRSERDEFKAYSNNLSEEFTILEEKLANLDTTIVSYERTINNYASENKMLKEENSTHLTNISNLKESNFILNQNILDLKRDHEVLIEKLQELENVYFDKLNYFNERELKLDSTIQQQTKLIDFLQLKLEECGKKKKSFSDKLFGQSKKENVAPLSIVLNYKDLENELKKEKQVTSDLRQELFKLKSGSCPGAYSSKENNVLKNKDMKILEQIVQSPHSQKNDLLRQKSLQRMRHKIPHRFESKLCTRSSKCVHCNNQIFIGKTANICQECNIVAHGSCASLIPKTCGLPNAYVQHFENSVNKVTSTQKEESVYENSKINVEGWVKIPGQESNNWDKHYACLVGSILKIFTSKPVPNLIPIETIDLLPLDGQAKVILEPSSSEIDIAVANRDLPFIIKLEVFSNSTCWPPKCLIFMTLNLEDKERWFLALESVVKQNQKYNGQEIIQLKENLDVNCAVEILNNALLLGTDKGLYCHYKDGLRHISGFGSVHQIMLIPNLNMALMIVNTNRILIKCDLHHLKDLSQSAPFNNPTLKFSNVNVNNLTGFHIFQTSNYEEQLILCIATCKQVVVLIYNMDCQDFKPLRILDTAEPTSCMMFTQHSLIIGADKFFEVDLNTFEADEFLDISDFKLSHAVMCSSIGSFPLAVLQISKNPIEYLVCFKEFACFVDEFGRSTRDSDLKWTNLPVAFHYSAPYLYVVTFSSVEMIKISSNKSELDVSVSKLKFNNIRYLGNGKNGVYVKIANEIKFIQANCLESANVSCSSIELEQTDENQLSDRFSFTSSMVHSLDGNLSDDGSEFAKSEMKKVQFTDL